MIGVTAATYPEIHAAFRAIEEDNGGDLIGTVYPGEPLDLETFNVPAAWTHLLPSAEAALARLRATSIEELETFLTGEMTEAEAVENRQGDLASARTLLNDYFNGWQDEDRPQAAGIG